MFSVTPSDQDQKWILNPKSEFFKIFPTWPYLKVNHLFFVFIWSCLLSVLIWGLEHESSSVSTLVMCNAWFISRKPLEQ